MTVCSWARAAQKQESRFGSQRNLWAGLLWSKFTRLLSSVLTIDTSRSSPRAPRRPAQPPPPLSPRPSWRTSPSAHSLQPLAGPEIVKYSPCYSEWSEHQEQSLSLLHWKLWLLYSWLLSIYRCWCSCHGVPQHNPPVGRHAFSKSVTRSDHDNIAQCHCIS